MSVLIKGMEMPTRCADCWLMDGEDSWCCACQGKRVTADYRYGIKDRPDWCPLIPTAKGPVLVGQQNVRPVILCRDCMYSPSGTDNGPNKGCGLEWPHDDWPEENPCPCKCTDDWYSHKPKPDFFCANGKAADAIEEDADELP